MYITDEDNPRLPFLRDKTSKLTTSPGCYIMKDKMKKIIYIGKAKKSPQPCDILFQKVSGSPAKGVENGVPRL